MPRWLTRILNAIGVGLAKPVDPLPPDARRELDRWDPETVQRYHDHGGCIAPPDAPHIPDDGI